MTIYPSVVEIQACFGGQQRALAQVLAKTNKPVEAEQAYREAVRMLENVIVEAPELKRWKNELDATRTELDQLPAAREGSSRANTGPGRSELP